MGEEYYQKIFAANLRYYMELNGKTQTDLINDLGFNKSTVSTWVNGTRLPRMDKVEMLAKYFGINRSDLINERNTEPAAPTTLAAHFEGQEFTPEEIEEIKKFAEFVKSKKS